MNNKVKVDKFNKRGICKLSSNGCEATYVGCTIRPLDTRIKDHLTRSNSAFGHHLSFKKHNFSPNSN